MKRGIYIFLGILITLSFISCKIEPKADYEIIAPDTVEMGDISLNGFQIKISGQDTISVDESMLAQDSILAFYKEGTQTIKINYKGQEHEVKIEVQRRHFSNIIFDDVETNYTGEAILIEVSGDIPASSNIWYPYGNSFINPGVYNVTALVSAPYYETITLQATLTIKEADL